MGVDTMNRETVKMMDDTIAEMAINTLPFLSLSLSPGSLLFFCFFFISLCLVRFCDDIDLYTAAPAAAAAVGGGISGPVHFI